MEKSEKRRLSWLYVFGDKSIEDALFMLPTYSLYSGLGYHWTILFGRRSLPEAQKLLERFSKRYKQKPPPE